MHFSTSSTIITLVADEETKTKQAPLAHLVEHLTLNQGAPGGALAGTVSDIKLPGVVLFFVRKQ